MHYIFCPHCGHRIGTNSLFCPYCGYKVGPNHNNNQNISHTYNDQIPNTPTHIASRHGINNLRFNNHNKIYTIVGTILILLMISCYLFYRHTVPANLESHVIKGSNNFSPMSSSTSSDSGKGNHSPQEYFEDEAIFGEYTETESDFYDEYDSDDEFSEEDSSEESDSATSDSGGNDSDSGNSDNSDSDNSSSGSDSGNSSSGSDPGASDSGGDSGSDDNYHFTPHTPYFIENLDNNGSNNHNIHNSLSYKINPHSVILHIQLGKKKVTARYKIDHVYRYNDDKVKLDVTGTNKYSKNNSFTFNKLSSDHYVVHASNGSHKSVQHFDGKGLSFSR